MQTEGTSTGLRRLGFMALLAAGLALGAAQPALAEVGGSEIVTACSEVETVSPGESEVGLPPMPGRSGQPF